MKLSLVTTTIHVPQLLKSMRALDPSVDFFVAGDIKTPAETADFCKAIPNCYYYGPQEQRDLGYACSDLIGWNCIQRRNIALLEALKSGAEAIILWDDDNAPITRDYFARFRATLGQPFAGIFVRGDSGWFDVGDLLSPRASHRGFPHDVWSKWTAGHVADVKVGVAAGLCLGDPDISAATRIAVGPEVHGVSELARAGVVVDPSTRTVFNSQNVAFTRDLAPCFLMVPQFQRYDDILASLIAQRVMKEMNLAVHFGPPAIWQSRNPHNLVKDLKAEMFGMERIRDFAAWLDNFVLSYHGNVLSPVDALYSEMATRLSWMPTDVYALGRAWLQDLEKVL